MALIRGHVNEKNGTHMVQDDFYTFVTKDLKVTKSKDKNLFFTFKTEIEGLNFLNYLKTFSARFFLSINKVTSTLDRGEFSCVPWLDFTQEWTDEKLYKYFNISNEEIEFIQKHIVKYYDTK